MCMSVQKMHIQIVGLLTLVVVFVVIGAVEAIPISFQNQRNPLQATCEFNTRQSCEFTSFEACLFGVEQNPELYVSVSRRGSSAHKPQSISVQQNDHDANSVTITIRMPYDVHEMTGLLLMMLENAPASGPQWCYKLNTTQYGLTQTDYFSRTSVTIPNYPPDADSPLDSLMVIAISLPVRLPQDPSVRDNFFTLQPLGVNKTYTRPKPEDWIPVLQLSELGAAVICTFTKPPDELGYNDYRARLYKEPENKLMVDKQTYEILGVNILFELPLEDTTGGPTVYMVMVSCYKPCEEIGQKGCQHHVEKPITVNMGGSSRKNLDRLKVIALVTVLAFGLMGIIIAVGKVVCKLTGYKLVIAYVESTNGHFWCVERLRSLITKGYGTSATVGDDLGNADLVLLIVSPELNQNIPPGIERLLMEAKEHSIPIQLYKFRYTKNCDTFRNDHVYCIPDDMEHLRKTVKRRLDLCSCWRWPAERRHMAKLIERIDDMEVTLQAVPDAAEKFKEMQAARVQLDNEITELDILRMNNLRPVCSIEVPAEELDAVQNDHQQRRRRMRNDSHEAAAQSAAAAAERLVTSSTRKTHVRCSAKKGKSTDNGGSAGSGGVGDAAAAGAVAADDGAAAGGNAAAAGAVAADDGAAGGGNAAAAGAVAADDGAAAGGAAVAAAAGDGAAAQQCKPKSRYYAARDVELQYAEQSNVNNHFKSSSQMTPRETTHNLRGSDFHALHMQIPTGGDISTHGVHPGSACEAADAQCLQQTNDCGAQEKCDLNSRSSVDTIADAEVHSSSGDAAQATEGADMHSISDCTSSDMSA